MTAGRVKDTPQPKHIIIVREMKKMYNKNISTKDAQRNEQGLRTGFKVMIKVQRPMSQEGFKRWGIRQRTHISKSRKVWVYYHSTRARGIPNGIPTSIMTQNDKTLAIYLIDTFMLSNGETYALHSWNKCSRSRTGVKLTKPLFIITIHDAENYKYTIQKSNGLNRYFFRKDKKNRRPETE